MKIAYNRNDMVCAACGLKVSGIEYSSKYHAWLCPNHYRHHNTEDMIWSRTLMNHFTTPAPHDNDQIVANELGGKQSKLEYAYELIEPDWLRDIAHVLYTGRLKYGARNWQSIPDYREHLGRAMYHIQQALEDIDHSEMHFANAGCRLMFADWCYKRLHQDKSIAIDHVEENLERIHDTVQQLRRELER